MAQARTAAHRTQSRAQMSAGAGTATGTGTGTGTDPRPSPSSSDNTSLEAFLQSLVPPFTNSNSGTSPTALPYSAQLTLLESHVQRLRSDLARGVVENEESMKKDLNRLQAVLEKVDGLTLRVQRACEVKDRVSGCPIAFVGSQLKLVPDSPARSHRRAQGAPSAIQRNYERAKGDLVRNRALRTALSTLHSARQSIESLRSLLSQGPLNVQAFAHAYTSASEEVSAIGNGEQEWLSKTTAARAIARDWTELEGEIAQELRGACEAFLSVREEDAWIVLCSKSARAHSTSNEPTPISNLFEIQAAISAEQAGKTLERLAARLLDVLRGLLHVSLLDESSDGGRSCWQASATSDSWSAHRSHEAETSSSAPQAIRGKWRPLWVWNGKRASLSAMWARNKWMKMRGAGMAMRRRRDVRTKRKE
ncbi:hypothetical protein IE81DRAFT_257127 [Ceraceosorus guamensis]|uniref:Uncharacterized protein n=1 Tax=Ceraceosorus guamensis TaxID=1522189 RepID=A0A316VR16_9BASI|nr:hypothetical protein IE81DRAFT_257127 [Ceraceosorus guamensis]PWN39790.1 hypothetical protein IE81DRAFT_257127 [Ceraceosorus guamensis]